MEARAAFSGRSVPKAFVVVVLVIVAMGLAAMAGYVARGLSGAASVQGPKTVHAAPGTVLRQDSPAQVPAELPSYIQQEIASKPTPRILQDDPYFIGQYGNTSKAASDEGVNTRESGPHYIP
jgi:hypothetical protein